MNIANSEIRCATLAAGLRQWQVAELIGMNESAYSRKLRKELSKPEKEKILAAIKKVVEGGI